MLTEVQFLTTYCIYKTIDQEFTFTSNCDLNYPKSIRTEAQKSYETTVSSKYIVLVVKQLSLKTFACHNPIKYTMW